MAVTEPVHRPAKQGRDVIGFAVLIMLLAAIACGSAWLYVNYPYRESISGYWGRVVAVGLCCAIVLKVAVNFKPPHEERSDDDTSERQMGVSELTRAVAFAACVGVATWSSITSTHRWTLLLAALTGILLGLVVWKTREFLDQLEQRRYRGAASSVEWGWLLTSILAGEGFLPSGTKLLGAVLATATAVPFALYLRRREMEELAHLPPAPGPTALPLEAAEDLSTEGPWEGLPPIKRLL